MQLVRFLITLLAWLAVAWLPALSAAAQKDALPSWNDGPTKQAIMDFVARVANEGGPDFVKPEERIAVFDNDGTLWAEQPLYFQFIFAIDRVKALAPQHPEWQDKEPFASLLKGDMRGALGQGEHAIVEILATTHSGMSTDEFNPIVKDWLKTARHPKTGKPFTDMAYEPMLELLGYLRANDFKTFIVTGGGIEFVRTFAEDTYGVPPEQVVGSSVKLKFQFDSGVPRLEKLPEVDFVDDGDGKPVGIQMHVGRRPIAAFGNSDGDLAMLQWTCSGAGPHFCLYVHHTDAEREWTYDRQSDIGKLDKGLDAAADNGWTVVDMKSDWRRIFSFEK
jgi:hypothetical protein